jgi:hypothetical protein
MAAHKFQAHVIRRIAVAANRDPRTVVAALEGRASPLATSSVNDAIEKLGLTAPAADSDPPPAAA